MRDFAHEVGVDFGLESFFEFLFDRVVWWKVYDIIKIDTKIKRRFVGKKFAMKNVWYIWAGSETHVSYETGGFFKLMFRATT